MIKAADDPKTPAKPSERRSGSSRNPQGSASGSRGGIKLSEANIKTLENKRDEHNEKYKDSPSKKANLGTLKAVFRRGAGAFSTSHRPSVSSRDQWAFGRVNAYLHLLGTGKPKNSEYITDNDLLPDGHPRATEKSLAQKGEEWDAIYNAILERTGDKELAAATATARAGSRLEKKSYKAPQSVVREVNQGFAWEKEYNRSDAKTNIGRMIQRGKPLSLDMVKGMVSFFAGHERDIVASEANRNPRDRGYPGAGLIAWKLWGGDAGRKWAEGVVAESRKEPAEKSDIVKAKSVKIDAPDGYHWMDYVEGPVLMVGDYQPHDGASDSFTFEVIEEHDPDNLRKADNFKPPKGVQSQAALGLKWRREYGRGGTEIGVARARTLSNGDGVPLKTINRMVSYFARHEVDLKPAKNNDPGADGYPGAGLIAWKLWGGNEGKRWADAISAREKKKDGVKKASKEYLEAALKLAKEELPGWAYAKIHQAARGTAGGRRRHAKAGSRLLAKMAINQMTQNFIEEMADQDIQSAWEFLDGWYQDHKRDAELKPEIVRVGSMLMAEMTRRGKKCPSCDLMREATNHLEVEKAQLRKLNKSSVSVHSPNSPIVFVVEEPNSIDKARGEYLVGQDGRVFKELYLSKLGIEKSNVCIVDITQLDWLETKKPQEVIALGRVAKNALGDLATCTLPHPKAVRRFGDSGEVGRKLEAVLKRSRHFLLDLDSQNSPILDTRAEEDKNAQADELINKQGGVNRDLSEQSESLVVPISKADSEKQIVYGVVLDPYQVDSQDDWVPPKAVEETAHRWLAESRVIGLDHSEVAKAHPVESYMVPYPSREDYDNAMANEPHRAYTMPFGDDIVHSGSWVLGTKLGDEEWASVKDGELNAYSIGGYGNRKKTTKSKMPQVEFIELKEER